jgi:hypothetical protein
MQTARLSLVQYSFLTIGSKLGTRTSSACGLSFSRFFGKAAKIAGDAKRPGIQHPAPNPLLSNTLSVKTMGHPFKSPDCLCKLLRHVVAKHTAQGKHCSLTVYVGP